MHHILLSEINPFIVTVAIKEKLVNLYFDWFLRNGNKAL